MYTGGASAAAMGALSVGPSIIVGNRVLNGYSNYPEGKSLPPIVPVEMKGEVMWAYLDTGSAKNFVSRDAAKKLNWP